LHHFNLLFDFQPIDPNDPKFFAISEGNKRKLRVNNVTNKDEGLYKCKVQDKVTQGKLYVARKLKEFAIDDALE
jgi:hypothetical protein